MNDTNERRMKYFKIGNFMAFSPYQLAFIPHIQGFHIISTKLFLWLFPDLDINLYNHKHIPDMFGFSTL